MSKKEVTAIIVARGGSVRVKNKALRNINGEKLIIRKIRQLKEAKNIDRIIVGSDNNDILNCCREMNVELVTRPEYYCDESKVSANEMIENMCSLFSSDIVLWAHCTNPLITSNTYDKAIETYFSSLSSGYDSLLSVIKIKEHLWSSQKLPMNYNPYSKRHKLSSELDPVYVQDGGIFIQAYDQMKNNTYFFGEKPMLFEVPFNQYLDINTEYDLKLANHILAVQKTTSE